MKNVYKKIGDGIMTVPKSMYGCCNWGGLPEDYLVSLEISKLVWERLNIDEAGFNHIYEVIGIIVTRDFYDRQAIEYFR